ncbi:MAG TPA: hypothetical protein VH308_09160 [Terracidiphilus sp.]|jgi:hypothetical protein|nr:hypothetical protein [Terracidiphilus sp.]
MTVLSLGKRLAVSIAMATALVFSVPAGHAASAKNLEKQAKKIEGKLANFPKGAFLHLFFRDGSDSSGKLNNLSDNSFTFTNLDSNANETHPYTDVTRVEKGKEYIGEGSGPKKHIHIF